MDRFVTQEELKREEDAAKSDMEKAEAKAKETLDEIGAATSAKADMKAESKFSSGGGAVGPEDDSDDDTTAQYLKSSVSMGDRLDSIAGSVAERARYIPLRLSYEGNSSSNPA